jgi:predicted small lipoprotein YifL
MRTALTAPLALACLLSLMGCNRDPAVQSTKTASADHPVTQDIKQIEYGVQLAAANKRIDELERKVGALENTPERLDLDLLTQRVTVLEVKSSDAKAPVGTIARATGKAQSVSGAPRASGGVPRAQTTEPKLNLPDLEKGARPATPSEAKTFSSKPQS